MPAQNPWRHGTQFVSFFLISFLCFFFADRDNLPGSFLFSRASMFSGTIGPIVWRLQNDPEWEIFLGKDGKWLVQTRGTLHTYFFVQI